MENNNPQETKTFTYRDEGDKGDVQKLLELRFKTSLSSPSSLFNMLLTFPYCLKTPK
jgi:hypothetical protein